MVAGRDVVVVRPAGNGKTLVAMTAARHLGGLTLVVLPLLALAHQWARSLNDVVTQIGIDGRQILYAEVLGGSSLSSFHGEASEDIFGGSSASEPDARLRDKTLRGEPDAVPLSVASDEGRIFRELQTRLAGGGGQRAAKVVLVAPERLESAAQCWALIGKTHKRKMLSLLVADEAHCIETQADEFRGAYLQLACIRAACPPVPWMLLTASASPASIELICSRLGVAQPYIDRAATIRPQMAYAVRWCGSEQSAHALLIDRVAACLRRGKRAMVYVSARRRADALAAHVQGALRQVELHTSAVVVSYHAGQAHEHRRASEVLWQHGSRGSTADESEEGDDAMGIDGMVATVAFGMGVDVGDVGAVFDYDVPSDMYALYQQESRAGRDHAAAEGELFFSLGRWFTLCERRQGASLVRSSDQEHYGLTLCDELLAYALNAHQCRHQQLEWALGGDVCMSCASARLRDGSNGPSCDVCLTAEPAQAFTTPLRQSRVQTVIEIHHSEWVPQLLALAQELQCRRVMENKTPAVSARALAAAWLAAPQAPTPAWVRAPLLGHAVLRGVFDRSFADFQWTHRETGDVMHGRRMYLRPAINAMARAAVCPELAWLEMPQRIFDPVQQSAATVDVELSGLDLDASDSESIE